MIINNNTRDGSKVFIDVLGGNNGTDGNISATGNVNAAITPVKFMEPTVPTDFDWRKIEVWNAYSVLYDAPIFYEYGDYVIEFETEKLYQNIYPATTNGQEFPLTNTQVWKEIPMFTDDYRLDPTSPYQTMGLTDKVSVTTPMTGLTLSAAGGATGISEKDGTLSMSVEITPTNASIKTMRWSLINGTGKARIDTTGLVTAEMDGTVIVKAESLDGSGKNLTLTNQNVALIGLSVAGSGGATTITVNKAGLQMLATTTPANASIKSVTWSLINGTGLASLDSNGYLRPLADGTVTVCASSTDGSGINASCVVTISNQILVTAITVTSADGATTIDIDKGMLQMNAAITPSDACVGTVTWTVENGTGSATIDANGLLTAVSNGTVTLRATANDRSGVSGIFEVTLSNQI